MNTSFLIIQCHDKNFKFYRQLAKATITGATRCFARSRIITTPPARWRWSFSRSTSWTRCKSGSRRFSAMSPISMQDYFFIMNKHLLQTPGWKRCFQIKPEKTYIVFISDCHVRLCSINVFPTVPFLVKLLAISLNPSLLPTSIESTKSAPWRTSTSSTWIGHCSRSSKSTRRSH